MIARSDPTLPRSAAELHYDAVLYTDGRRSHVVSIEPDGRISFVVSGTALSEFLNTKVGEIVVPPPTPPGLQPVER